MARAANPPIGPPSRDVALGMGLRLVSALSLALMFAGVKWVGQRGAGVVETLFYRQIGSVVCAAAFVALRTGLRVAPDQALRRPRDAHGDRRGRHAAQFPDGDPAAAGRSDRDRFLGADLRDFAGGDGAAASRPARWRWGAVIVGFLGVLVIVQPGSGHIGAYGGLVALGAVLQHGLRHHRHPPSRRDRGGRDDGLLVRRQLAGPARPGDAVRRPAARRRGPSRRSPGSASPAGSPSCALTGSLRLAPVALVMPMDYSALLWASLLGLVRCSTKLPSHWTWLGAPIVIAAGLVILWREQHLRTRCERACRGPGRSRLTFATGPSPSSRDRRRG